MLSIFTVILYISTKYYVTETYPKTINTTKNVSLIINIYFITFEVIPIWCTHMPSFFRAFTKLFIRMFFGMDLRSFYEFSFISLETRFHIEVILNSVREKLMDGGEYMVGRWCFLPLNSLYVCQIHELFFNDLSGQKFSHVSGLRKRIHDGLNRNNERHLDLLAALWWFCRFQLVFILNIALFWRITSIIQRNLCEIWIRTNTHIQGVLFMILFLKIQFYEDEWNKDVSQVQNMQ